MPIEKETNRFGRFVDLIQIKQIRRAGKEIQEAVHATEGTA